jgi:hypothetical protein
MCLTYGGSRGAYQQNADGMRVHKSYGERDCVIKVIPIAS